MRKPVQKNIVDVLDIINNIKDLYENNDSFETLKNFERVLDNSDIYVYDNWFDGELAYGPIEDRYWITAAFMWPKRKMPDPKGAERLIKLGCDVKYEKSYLIQPKPIESQDDFRPGTKKGKIMRLPFWIVEIIMPKKLVFETYKGHMSKLKNDAEKSINPLTPNSQASQQPATQAPPMGGASPPMGGISPPMGGISPPMGGASPPMGGLGVPM